jgi:hypothetical protein
MMYMRNLPVFSLICALIAVILLCAAGCLNVPGSPAGNQSGITTLSTTIPLTPSPTGTSYVLVETLAPDTPPVAASPAYQDLAVPGQPGDTVQNKKFTFQYRGVSHAVGIPVNTSLYLAARDSPNKHLNLSGANETAVFYRQMLQDPAMDPFFSNLISELSRERYTGGDNMTGDEYLEMVTGFVQQIPAVNRTGDNPRYPVEVIADGQGTNEEKAMLLTGILSRQGYDTAFIRFPGTNRAGSGIGIHLASNHPSFRVFSTGSRDYVFIDTDTTRLIGIYDDQIATAPDPLVIPLGNGTAGYSHLNFVMDIFTDIRSLERELKAYNEKAGVSGQLNADDYQAAVSYYNTYVFVMSTNDRDAAYSTIRASELPHHTSCVTCG